MCVVGEWGESCQETAIYETYNKMLRDYFQNKIYFIPSKVKLGVFLKKKKKVKLGVFLFAILNSKDSDLLILSFYNYCQFNPPTYCVP